MSKFRELMDNDVNPKWSPNFELNVPYFWWIADAFTSIRDGLFSKRVFLTNTSQKDPAHWVPFPHPFSRWHPYPFNTSPQISPLSLSITSCMHPSAPLYVRHLAAAAAAAAGMRGTHEGLVYHSVRSHLTHHRDLLRAGWLAGCSVARDEEEEPSQGDRDDDPGPAKTWWGRGRGATKKSKSTARSGSRLVPSVCLHTYIHIVEWLLLPRSRVNVVGSMHAFGCCCPYGQTDEPLFLTWRASRIILRSSGHERERERWRDSRWA